MYGLDQYQGRFPRMVEVDLNKFDADVMLINLKVTVDLVAVQHQIFASKWY